MAATLELQIEGIEPALSVRRFSIRDDVSDLFAVSIVARSSRPDLDLDEVIFKPASFSIAAGLTFAQSAQSAKARVYTGLCESIEQIQAEPSGLSTYSIRIVPRLWLLTLRTSYRIFQHVTIPAIATRILDELSVPHVWQVDRSAHPKLDYKVQYGESDFAFLCRLCEEAGVTFSFQRDEASQSLLVFRDAPCAVEARAAPLPYVDNPSESAEREFVTSVRQFRRGQASSVALLDYDFRNPSLPLAAQAGAVGDSRGSLEYSRYEPGAFRRVTSAPTSTPVADKLGVARHEPSYGEERAERILLGRRPGGSGVSFETNAMDIAPGAVFSIAGHPHPRLDESRRLFVTQLLFEGEHDKEWRARGRAVLADEPYRPPRRTPKPVVHGLSSAVVTGPKDREVFTDEYGRVRVQFPWDREGKRDEQSSCWIRVSQAWAGAGFGIHAVPRVGQEVLVGFLGGDPDEPIIVGRASNGHNPPPYPLPANETKTVWRSQSTPGADGFNEISFEDKRGEERLYERAERDKETRVRNDEELSVGRNRAKVVKKDEDALILGDRRELVGGDDHRTVKGEQRERTEGSRSLIIDDDWQVRVSGRLSMAVGGEIHLYSETKIVLHAPDITEDAGGGVVRTTGAGVALDGPAVTIQAGGAPATGEDSAPALPDLPAGRSALFGMPGLAQGRLPSFPSGVGPVVGNVGLDYERGVICRAICGCDGAHNGAQRVSQWCVTLALWEYDRRLGHQSTIKAEVHYDMSQSPPVPVMSKKDPRRTSHGKARGTVSPDIVVLYDGTKPPTQDNIRKVYEVKFGNDKLDGKKRRQYTAIAGEESKFEVLRPEDCDCAEKRTDPLPSPISAKDAAKLVFLALAAIALLLSPAPGKGRMIPAIVRKIMLQLAPLLR
jgi:type VI secretion system secreted protein VgrG